MALAYLAAGLAVAAVLWVRGPRIAAAILAALLLGGLLLAVLVPRVALAADAAREAVQRTAGRVLSVVLLTLVQLLVFLPVWLVLRLLRIDPLGGPGRDAASYWVPARPHGARPLPRRHFTYEPERVLGGATRRRGRVRAAAGLVAILVALDLGLGAVLHRVDASSGAADSAAPGRQSLLFFPDIAAARGAPWLRELAGEIDRVWYAKRFDSFLGWETPSTFRSRWLNISGGARRSYAPTAGTRRALRVAFLGGSTMFGLFQRDGHTIPSEVARLAERDGIRLEAANLGRMAYNNWQETLLLTERVARGMRPDLAVFYDGNNELVGQFRLGPHRVPAHQEATEYAERIGFGLTGAEQSRPAARSRPSALLHAWTELSGATWVLRRLRGAPTEGRSVAQPLTSAWIENQRGRARVAGRDAADVYAQGVRAGRALARGEGFAVRHFWQPIIYSKPRVAGERQALGALGTDPAAWTEAYRVARAGLPAGVADISGALDEVRSPVMYDFVHTNELGARVVATAIYRRLRPELLRLRDARR